MPTSQTPRQQPHRQHGPRPTDDIVFQIGDGLPHDVEDDDDSLSTSASSWDHLAGFLLSAFSQWRTHAPTWPVLPGPSEPFSGQESDYMSSDESGDENHVPAQPAPQLPPRSPSISSSTFFSLDSDTESEPTDSDTRAHLAPQLPPRSPSISSSTFFSLDSDTESEPAHRDTPAQPASRLPLRFPSIDPITFFRLDSDTESESSDSDTPTQPAPRLPLRFPSFTPDDFFNVDFDAESDPGDLGTRAQPAVVVPEIDDLNAPWHEPLAASDADARHEGKDIWHFLWQNTLYSSAKGFVINTAMAALGGSGTSALAAQAPARAMDATIAAVQTFLSIRRVLNNGMNKKKTYAEASWMEISGEIAFSSATALIGGAIAYFNPSSNVFKRISDVVVGTAEAYRPNLVMKFSPTGEAKATLMSERGHANLTTLLKYAVKRALKEAAFPHALAAPDAEALKGTNPFMMQYIYKSLIDTIVDLFVDVYISLAYKEAAKHVMGIPYQFKDRKPATSEDPFMQRAQKNISKAGIKSGYKIIGSSASDIFTALPNALGTDVPGVPKNVLSIAGALFNGFIAGEVDAHNAHNAAKGESDANVDEQHYENQPSPSTSMERVTVQR